MNDSTGQKHPCRLSLIIPVYAKDSPDAFRMTLDSVTRDQLRPPDETIVVCDGPITEELNAVLAEVAETWPRVLRILRLPSNVGAARARNAGFEIATGDFWAICDADDVSLPERFQLQLKYLTDHPEIDLVAAWVQEIDEDDSSKTRVRTAPADNAELRRLLRYRNPFFNSTVMIRRSLFATVGGFPDLHRVEDYAWQILIQGNNLQAHTLQQVLVNYRAGDAAFARSGDRRLLRQEPKLRRLLSENGLAKRSQLILPAFVRGVYLLLPTFVQKRLFHASFTKS